MRENEDERRSDEGKEGGMGEARREKDAKKDTRNEMGRKMEGKMQRENEDERRGDEEKEGWER